MRFQFIARCEGQTLPLEVDVEFKPGRQSQYARRVAAGQLMARLEVQRAIVDASGEDRVTVDTGQGIWVIAEGGSIKAHRRLI